MKKRLKGFFQRLARWLNVREMRQHKVKAGVYISNKAHTCVTF